MTQSSRSFWFTPKGFSALGLIGAASYFLFVEHRQHLFEFLPYLILLLCPLMHIFMHGGHGHGGNNNHESHHESDNEAYRRGLEDGRKENRSRQQ